MQLKKKNITRVAHRFDLAHCLVFLTLLAQTSNTIAETSAVDIKKQCEKLIKETREICKTEAKLDGGSIFSNCLGTEWGVNPVQKTVRFSFIPVLGSRPTPSCFVRGHHQIGQLDSWTSEITYTGYGTTVANLVGKKITVIGKNGKQYVRTQKLSEFTHEFNFQPISTPSDDALAAFVEGRLESLGTSEVNPAIVSQPSGFDASSSGFGK